MVARTSILDRLSGSRCDAATARDGGQALLEAPKRFHSAHTARSATIASTATAERVALSALKA